MGCVTAIRSGLCLSLLAILSFGVPVSAQMADMSPTLLIEVGPSDNPDYRRMVFVKYLAGDSVTVAYKAYNRAEFIQVPDSTPEALIMACRNGNEATLEQITAYQDEEEQAREAGELPAMTHFCIKNVSGWEAGNRAAYLDPIFEGMPHAAVLNN